ncbi:hypothetical protein JTE90_027342 [Oedothorax gibbosus]|uniref:Zinc finger CW-type PWWP domain protein 1 n=1 Tax=Oedothorax gibbosus TaxID=931172 RepID=A0AAV6VZ05_9ARAC|nr:hypothetical protein JTE90_027342 [Oedothorax gibbosus]
MRIQSSDHLRSEFRSLLVAVLNYTHYKMPKRSRPESDSSEGTSKLTTRERLLLWNKFYSSGSKGVGVECVVCKKWRRVLEFDEPWQVPEHWECKMTFIDGQVGSCLMPTTYTAEDFVDDEFIPGSIVWAKCPKYPWWPAMVEDDPDDAEYERHDENRQVEYHVVFFNDTAQRGWIKEKNLKQHRYPPKKDPVTKKKYKLKQMESLARAVKKAEEAAKMKLQERLEKFSFAVVYQAKFPVVKKDDKVPIIPLLDEEHELDDKVPTIPLVNKENELEVDDHKNEVKETLEYVLEKVISLIAESETTEESEDESDKEERTYSPINIPPQIANKEIDELFSDVDSEPEEVSHAVAYTDPVQHEKMCALFHKWFQTPE